VLHVAPSRSTLRVAAILAAGLLAACGSSRKVAEGGDVCLRCHGGANAAGNAAPPKAIDGGTATTELGVGAHQAHLVAGRLRGPIACNECHVVPADMQEHEAGIAAIAAGTAQRVTFGPLADAGPAVAAWNRASAKCSSTYCHGATLNHGGTNQQPTWTIVDPVTHPQAACGTCHGFPPPAPHPALPTTIPPGYKYCGECHSATTPDGFTIVVTGGVSTHIDGLLTIDATACSGGGCACCHGAPPATGAHLAHATSLPTAYGVDSKTADTLNAAATTYDFGCGSCHPTELSKHTTGLVDLSPLNATAGSLKARNAVGAAYNATNKSCDGVYCHSSGQQTPAFVASPGWFSGATLGCGGCHDNPPKYVNGGAGTATANSHVALVLESDAKTYETGHFGGFPAAFHAGSFHGLSYDDSSPITCQTCHYDSVDPANAGPSGFYYLDTGGSYDLGGTGDFNIGAIIFPVYACTNCHNGAPPAPTAQGGRARPYSHVNGTRDVAFDRRPDFSTATGTLSLPASPNTPTRPYWYTRATTNNSSGAASPAMAVIGTSTDAVLDGTTISMRLGTASWNAASQTCSSVVCHFARMAPASQPLRWGEFGLPPDAYNATLDGSAVCSTCHNM
jgi:predicted CxxxxCH...CXXCH cytochrome family protein